MENYNLTQTGPEVQEILDNATPQSELTAETQRAQLAEQTLQGNIDAEAQARANAISAETQRAQLAEQTLQTHIDNEALTRENADTLLQTNIGAEETRAKAAEKQNADDIDALEALLPSGVSQSNKLVAQQALEAIIALIPSAASAMNKLADKAFVNSSIATNTATFRGTFNLVSDLHLPIDANHETIALNLLTVTPTADNNDFCYVQIPDSAETPTVIASTDRYKFNGTAWAFEYTLNTSGFTAAQWAAINSGITAAILESLMGIPALIPSEATDQNQLADKAYVLTQILLATPAFKGQFTTLAQLQAVTGAKAGDLGIVRTKDTDGHDVFAFYQYKNDQWTYFYSLSYHPQDKPATTGLVGEAPYNGMGRVELPMNWVEGWPNDTWLYYPYNDVVYLMYYWNGLLYAPYNSGTQEGLGLDDNLVVKPLDYNIADIEQFVGERYLPFTESSGVWTITKPDDSTITSTELNNTNIYKINDPTHIGINVLTQAMLNRPNTIYVIQYDYDLNGQTITVPENCVLEFDGGSITNGILAGNSTNLILKGACFKNTMFDGTFSCDRIASSNFDKESYAKTFEGSSIYNNFLRAILYIGCNNVKRCVIDLEGETIAVANDNTGMNEYLFSAENVNGIVMEGKGAKIVDKQHPDAFPRQPGNYIISFIGCNDIIINGLEYECTTVIDPSTDTGETKYFAYTGESLLYFENCSDINVDLDINGCNRYGVNIYSNIPYKVTDAVVNIRSYKCGYPFVINNVHYVKGSVISDVHHRAVWMGAVSNVDLDIKASNCWVAPAQCLICDWPVNTGSEYVWIAPSDIKINIEDPGSFQTDQENRKDKFNFKLQRSLASETRERPSVIKWSNIEITSISNSAWVTPMNHHEYGASDVNMRKADTFENFTINLYDYIELGLGYNIEFVIFPEVLFYNFIIKAFTPKALLRLDVGNNTNSKIIIKDSEVSSLNISSGHFDFINDTLGYQKVVVNENAASVLRFRETLAYIELSLLANVSKIDPDHNFTVLTTEPYYFEKYGALLDKFPNGSMFSDAYGVIYLRNFGGLVRFIAATKLYGNTVSRPTNATPGQVYYDTIINTPIFFSGDTTQGDDGWINANGKKPGIRTVGTWAQRPQTPTDIYSGFCYFVREAGKDFPIYAAVINNPLEIIWHKADGTLYTGE